METNIQPPFQNATVIITLWNKLWKLQIFQQSIKSNKIAKTLTFVSNLKGLVALGTNHVI